MSFAIPDLDGSPPNTPFPPGDRALDAHYGLVAVGGDWHPDRIHAAYRGGIFPWPMADIPLGWYCPPVRMVFDTSQQPLGRRFRKSLAGRNWTLTADTATGDVLRNCAAIPRKGQDGTWITAAMVKSYEALASRGAVHSIEVWDADGRLIGGLFGLCVRRLFCGDSMFSAEPGASRVAFAHLLRFLSEHGIPLVDGQIPNDYLQSLGGFEIPRSAFLRATQRDVPDSPLASQSWTAPFGQRTSDTLR